MGKLVLAAVGLVACTAGIDPTPDPTSGHGGDSSVESASTSATASSGTVTSATTASATTIATASAAQVVASASAAQGGVEVDGARIRIRYVDGTDGSKVRHGTWDAQLEVECSYRLAVDGQTRCLPISAYRVPGVFSDLNCSISVASIPCGTQAKYATEYTGTCSGERVYTVGNPVQNLYYRNSSGVCTSYSQSATGYFAIINELPSSTFVAGVIQ